MIIGTAGHIDHGKTSLVRALTGVDTDRLKEEKARGISIELGYAYTPLADGEVLGFVDVPGHERLVHTMVAGVGGIDYALLVVAADDGVMPQTREHLAILELLGVTHGAVALTKTDLADDARIRAVQAQIEALLAPTMFAKAPVFPLAATAPSGDSGVAALRAHLHATAAVWPKHPEDGLFRLAVDRVFTLPGRGTVVTGTARAGRTRVGDTLAVMPAGNLVRVRSIHAQNRDTGIGRAGERCALNLVGIERTALGRGDWLADPRALVPSTRFDVQMRRLADGRVLSTRAPLHIHVGTSHRVARVICLEGNQLNAGASARVQLVFDAPICASPGDAFIARDAQASRTVGGGTVIDPYAPARRRRSPERLARLDSIGRLLAGEGVGPLLGNSPQGVEMRELVRLSGRAPEQIALPAQARIVDAAGDRFVFIESQWQALCERAVGALRTFHAQQPDEPGVDRGRLRRMTLPALADPVWRAVIDDLVQRRTVQRNGLWLHLPEHRVAMSDDELELARKLHAAIAAGRFDPPWVRDLARASRVPDDAVRGVLRKSALQGGVHQIVRDLYYHRDCVRELARTVKNLVDEHGALEAARFRDAIGVGRKRAIQILEFFDRVGYTRRTRNARVLRVDSSWHEED
ncbi:MAG TPA: selenocysteine-specific translation elongation factor [Steroidobacteraceae bacterium]|nr:selenocysteine-specific translation elongation factor [Steroidobacteraceae bacterium]